MTSLQIERTHPDLLATIARVFEPCGFDVENLRREPESAEYAAYAFTLSGIEGRFRVAKTTPTKTGQFVTFWARNPAGPIRPYDLADPVEFLIVCVRKGGHFGQFVFSKSMLRHRGVVSTNHIGGKRAFRVYPPWDAALNRQAQRSQDWQRDVFLDMSPDGHIDLGRAKTLYGSISDNIP